MASPRRRVLIGFVVISAITAALCLVWFAFVSAPPKSLHIPATRPVTPPPPARPDVGDRLPHSAPPPPPETRAPPRELHEFPWPPPTPSTSYRIPDTYFGGATTIGAVTDQITRALETTGYVERRYYALPVPGVALVTRLEHINEDGSPATERWSREDDRPTLYQIFRGLYLIEEPGHYRVIVFMIAQDLPDRSGEEVSIDNAKAWLRYGLDDIPSDIASMPYKSGHTLAYVYDFTSRGRLTLDREPPPAQEQLKRAGILTALSTAAH